MSKQLAYLTEALKYNWQANARQNQLVNIAGGKPIELKMGGRGGGKTRTGSEFIRQAKDLYPIIHLIGPTAAAVRDVMVEGESGILSVLPRWEKAEYLKSQAKIRFHNGAVALCFSAEKPDRLRGPQCYAGWFDEIGAYKYPQETFDNYMMGARLGEFPKTLITTTPRRIPLIKDLVADKTMVDVTTYSTFANIRHLAKSYVDYLLHKYDGTTLGRQELYAELLSDVEGALWKMSIIDHARVPYDKAQLAKIMQGRGAIVLDPAMKSKKESDETGIIVGFEIGDGKCYPIEDLSGRYTPNEMAAVVVEAFYRWGLNVCVYEANQGGDFVREIIQNLDSNIPFHEVHAKTGKALRAEPVVAKYEQKKVCHVGVLPQLEDELTTWEPKTSDFSPNRVDALVYFVHWALIDQQFFVV